MLGIVKWHRTGRQRLREAKQSLTLVAIKEQRVNKTLAAVDEILEENGLGQKAAAALGMRTGRS